MLGHQPLALMALGDGGADRIKGKQVQRMNLYWKERRRKNLINKQRRDIVAQDPIAQERLAALYKQLRAGIVSLGRYQRLRNNIEGEALERRRQGDLVPVKGATPPSAAKPAELRAPAGVHVKPDSPARKLAATPPDPEDETRLPTDLPTIGFLSVLFGLLALAYGVKFVAWYVAVGAAVLTVCSLPCILGRLNRKLGDASAKVLGAVASIAVWVLAAAMAIGLLAALGRGCAPGGEDYDPTEGIRHP